MDTRWQRINDRERPGWHAVTCTSATLAMTWSNPAVANIKSAQKRARTSEKRRLANMAQRSRMRTYIKRVILDVESGDREAAQASYKKAVPVIDTMVNKGIIHKNKAARHKSRLNKMVVGLGG